MKLSQSKVFVRRRLLFGALITLVLSFSTACGGDDESAAVAEGTFTVRGGGIYKGGGGEGCSGNLPYNIQYREGLAVVVYSSTGEILGSGTLGPGKVMGQQNWCVLPFSFPLSGTSQNYEIAFGSGERVVVQDISAVDVGIGPQ